MRGIIVWRAAVLALVLVSSEAQAQPMPPTYEMRAAGIPPFPPPQASTYRPSALQIWQYYERDYLGYFRPIVIDAEPRGFYFYNGAPFPWVRTHFGEYWMMLGPSTGPTY
jgi:hypothetical protein